ncbi:hypothetical protein O0I10_009776 [Lichtheimia ornata]|uniref:Nudix hydrolase domain-containing protein n=1 Tax=Lichtheimia ornata TaxID=688661 RepID=A0AAD7UVU4_9FUNG|nr:uncharacterized protein O0I10_009776 [Lichtheimia ornata]KAJ8654594.1 hypothetical protein O0I10_009776 [Lichtheimia ornata]
MPPTTPIKLDPKTLALFSQRLLNCPRYKFGYKEQVRDAAVLMPLCQVNGEASVLFTVRNMNMRTHRGEISFPGGKADPHDPSLQHTALRETMEEVGIAPSSIDILGNYSTLPNKTGSLRVHPFLGYIKDPISSIKDLNYNKDEVSTVFSLPIDYLTRRDIREVRQFRHTQVKYPVFKVPAEIEREIEGENEIWGLTSFILDGIFRKIIPDRYP